MQTLETHMLDVPEGTLTYDVRGDLKGDPARVVLLVGFPMDASGFASLASHFGDRPVVTYDPRTTGRSSKSRGDKLLTPVDHAADLHRLIEALDVGAIDLFASSGGAIIALALVAEHPEQVRTLVAHEPPIASVLPDGDRQLAAAEDIHQTYQASGMGPAMAKFLALIAQKGPLPEDYASTPGPDPADFGLPTEDDGSRDDPMLGQSIRTFLPYQPDFEALAGASTRVVIAAGAESGDEMMARAAVGIADRLGSEPVIFPSHHGGFLGGEFGQCGDPAGFAAVLRGALDQGRT
jgi:pimeloyl-ACP methyl ester carboxylesterase